MDLATGIVVSMSRQIFRVVTFTSVKRKLHRLFESAMPYVPMVGENVAQSHSLLSRIIVALAITVNNWARTGSKNKYDPAFREKYSVRFESLIALLQDSMTACEVCLE